MEIENSKKLRLEVYDINKNILGILTDKTEYSVDNLQIDESINETTKVSFRVSNKNEKSKYLINENLVKLDNEYYIVKKPNFDTVEEEFQIECEHESLRLKEVLCGKISYIAETAESLITKILSGTGWIFGGTDIPTSKKRHLESDELSVFANLVEIANNFNARLKFSTDIVNGNEVKSVSLYSNPINNGRYIKNNRDLNGVNISYDSSEMVTRLYVYGRTDDGTGREINMMEAHPNKLPYVENFSYFKDLGYTDSEINAKKNQFVKELILRESSLYTPQEVYEFALEEVARLCYPKVEANVEILDLSCDDKFMKTPIQIGEIINVIDTNTDLIISANVVSISRDYENPLDVSVGISNVIEKNSTLKRMSQSTDIIEKIIDSGTDKIHGTYIKEATIGSAHLGQAIIQNAHIENGTIDSAKINKASIQKAVLEDAIIGSANIGKAAIQEAHIGNGVINNAHIGNGVITNAKIVNLDANKVNFDVGSGSVLQLQTLLSNFISGNSGQFLNLTGDNVTIANGVIKDAMIDTVNASKINSGQINTNLVNLLSANGNLIIKDNTIQIKDGTRTRVQIGLNGNNDYSINVWDSSGKLMFDSNGITDNAIKSKIIRDDMVSDTANISGEKLNIGSVIESINNDNTKTLKSSKINVDSENQTLDVIFNSLRTNIDSKESKNLIPSSKFFFNNGISLENYAQIIGLNNPEEMLPFLKVGETYTISFDSNSDTESRVIYLSESLFEYEEITISSKGRYKIISKYKGTKADYSLIKNHSSGSFIPNFSNLKIESGINHNPVYSQAPEDIEEKIQANTTALSIEQGRINTLISETDITKGQVNTLNNNYSSLNQTVGGITTTVGSHTTSIANVNTLANSKAKTFVTTPTTPYQIGDLWVQGTSGDLMRCKVARATGSYITSDWEKASKYTDDTKANSVEGVLNSTINRVASTESSISQLNDSIKLKVESNEVTTIANNAVNNLEIGFKNLLTMKNIDGYEITNLKKNGYNVTAQVNSQYGGIELLNLRDVMELNKEYIFQCKIRKTSGTLTNILLYQDVQFDTHEVLVDGIKRDIWDNSDMGINDDLWHTLTIRFTRTIDVEGDGKGDVNALLIQPNRSFATSVDVEVKDFKLEKGNKATDWMPAPEDVDDKIDNIEIGSRNYVRELGGDNYVLTRLYSTDGQYATVETINNKKWLKWTGNTGMRIYQILVEPNTTYTWSYTAYKTGTERVINCNPYDNSGGHSSQSFTITTTPIRISHTFTTRANTTYEIYHMFGLVASETYYFSDFTLVKGNKPMKDWIPAQEDTNSQISSIESRVEAAEIKITDKSIISTVSSTVTSTVNNAVNNLEIGGRNLLRESSPVGHGCLYVKTSEVYKKAPVYKITTNKDNVQSNFGLAMVVPITDITDGQYTVSFSYKFTVFTATVGITGYVRVAYTDGTSGYFYMNIPNQPTVASNLNKWFDVVLTFATDSTKTLSSIHSMYFYKDNARLNDSCLITLPKIEKGNKATDWTPAPEDVDSAISTVDGKVTTTNKNLSALSTRVETAESSITQLNSSIALKVESKYVTDTISGAVNNIQTMTKLNGVELLNQEYASNVKATPFPFTTGTYTVVPSTELSLTDNKNLIKATGSVFLRSDYIPYVPNNPYYMKLSAYNKDTTNGVLHVGIEFFDSNKVSLGSNDLAMYIVSADTTMLPVNTWKTFEGYINTNETLNKAGYIRIRILTRWSGFTGNTYLKDITVKQLGAYITSELESRVKTAEIKITDKSIISTVSSTVNTAKSEAISSANANTSNLLKSYSTTTQLNSEIKQLNDKIALKVESNEVTTIANNAVNNLKIGGRNYATLEKIKATKLTGTTTGAVLNINHTECPNGFHVTGNSGKTAVARITNVINKNGLWTISFDMKGSQSTIVGVLVDICDLSPTRLVTTNNNTWQRVSLTVNVTNYSSTYHFVDIVPDYAHIFIKNIKIEEGNKATDWTPAPEDIDNAISTVDNKVTTTNKKVSTIEADLSGITSRVGSVESTAASTSSGLSNLVTKVNSVAEEITEKAIISKVSSTITSAVNNIQVGGRNLLKDSGISILSNVYNLKNFILTETIPNGTEVTLSIKGELGSGKTGWGIYNSGGSVSITTLTPNDINSKGIYVKTFNWVVGTSANTSLHVYQMPNSVTVRSMIEWIKLEYGNKPTDWTPAPEDVDGAISTAQTNAINSANTSTDNKLKNYSTTLQMNTAINQTLDDIRLEVSKNYVTTTTADNTYATKGSLTLTDENLRIAFSSSGGYNLIRDSNLVKNLDCYWWYPSAGTVYPQRNNGFGFYTPVNSERGLYQTITVKPFTTYTFSALVATEGETKGAHIGIELGYEGRGATSKRIFPGFTERVSVTITTGNSTEMKVLVKHLGSLNNSGGFVVWVKELLLTEGSFALPWTPHPSEIYDGNTMIDNTGITVNNGGLRIKNNSGEQVFGADTLGNLEIIGNLKSKSLTTEAYVSMSSGGLTFRDSHKNEEIARMGTTHYPVARDMNGLNFSISKYSDFINFAWIDKPDLENGWSSTNNNQYHFMSMWHTASSFGTSKFYKGVNIHAPTTFRDVISITNEGDFPHVINNFSYNSVPNQLGLYGDNGVLLGARVGESNSTRLRLREAGDDTTGDWIESWGHWNMNSYTLHNATIRANSLQVTGSKNSLQATENYGERLINAYETAEYFFGDIGSGKIKDGECLVYIDEIFKECINTNIQYHIFTQVYGGNITKIERYKDYFIVYGEEGTEFSWELKAKRIGYENHRLDTIVDIDNVDLPEIISESDNPIIEEEIKKEIEFNLEEFLLEQKEGNR